MAADFQHQFLKMVWINQFICRRYVWHTSLAPAPSWNCFPEVLSARLQLHRPTLPSLVSGEEYRWQILRGCLTRCKRLIVERLISVSMIYILSDTRPKRSISQGALRGERPFTNTSTPLLCWEWSSLQTMLYSFHHTIIILLSGCITHSLHT